MSRRKGSKLTSPNGLPIVIVDRLGHFGNPFKLDGHEYDGYGKPLNISEAVAMYRQWLSNAPRYYLRRIHDELRGKNLACWCKTGTPCHADVLLEIGNA